MISAHAISSASGAATYHDKAFVQDGSISKADNYYVNETAPATWQGKAAELLGLNGKAVQREDFINLLDGRIQNPSTGLMQDLKGNSKGDARRCGFDFTVAAPKSVSIVGLVGGDKQVVEAHIAANQRAMEWLETNAALVRVKDAAGQNVKEKSGNLLWATVQHESSRANDPQLHNHNVIVAVTYDAVAKKWRSLTNDELLNLRASADTVYKAELAALLKEKGYELYYDRNGVDFEIKGVSREQIEGFSFRGKQIEEALVARGIDPTTASWAARQTAALDSRDKKAELTRDVLLDIWKERSQAVGLDPSTIVEKAKQHEQTIDKASLAEQADRHALRAVSWAVAHLSEREQAFKLPELQKTALEFGQVRPDSIEAVISKQISSGALIVKERTAGDDGATWITTPEARTREQVAINIVKSGWDRGNHVLSEEKEFASALALFEASKAKEVGATFKLSAEQVVAARNLLMHPDAYQGIQGDAGTGKTAMLEFVRKVAEEKGWDVVGMATTSSATKELEASSGIKSRTVASFLADRENQLAQARAEVNELRDALYGSTKSQYRNAPRVEVQVLGPRSRDLDFGVARYVFDHDRGEVFKTNADWRGAVGAWLQQKSREQGLQQSQVSLGNDGNVGVKGGDKGLVADVANRLGEFLAPLEKVGTVEAIAAKNELYLQHSDPSAVAKLHAKEAELANIEKTGNREGRQTIIVMDESSMTGTKDAEAVLRVAQMVGARTFLQGDVKQHASVPAGRFFEQLQVSGMHTSVLEETRRFDNATPQVKAAVLNMKQGLYRRAIEGIDRHEVSPDNLYKKTAERYTALHSQLNEDGVQNPRVGIVALTNADRKEVNAVIHRARQAAGELGAENFTKTHYFDPKLTEAQNMHASKLMEAKVDTLIFRKNYREVGITQGEPMQVVRYDVQRNRVTLKTQAGKTVEINPQFHDYFDARIAEDRTFSVNDKVVAREVIKLGDKKEEKITNGTEGVVSKIDKDGAVIRWKDGNETQLNNRQMAYVDLAYARTSHKEQGATNNYELVCVSKTGAKIFDRMAAYVADTRAKINTEIITADADTMLNSVSRESQKTTALDTDFKNLRRAGAPTLEKSEDKGLEKEGQSHSKDGHKSEKTQEQSKGFSLGR